jgi:methylmalonyl-CoA mutase
LIIAEFALKSYFCASLNKLTMSDIKQKLSFLDEFPEISSEEWRKKIDADLKGADFERKLVWRTNEGISVQPYYRQEDVEKHKFLDTSIGEFPFVRTNKENSFGWEIRQDIELNDAAKTNAQILEALSKGATSVGIITNGLVNDAEVLSTLLNGVDITKNAVNFITATDGAQVVQYIIDYCASNNIDTDAAKISVSLEPLSHLTETGSFYVSQEEDFNAIAEKAVKVSFRTISVNASVFHHAGANIIQELAFALSMGSEYLNMLTDKNADASKVASSMHFTFATGTNYFMEIAKFRAARLLWAKVVEAYTGEKSEAGAMQIHSHTSLWNKTVYDPYVNMLRVTTENMSAALGGVDSFTVHSFDKSFSEGSEFGERIARNTQIILKEEAYFDKIIDPAAGSYYIEELTAELADKAWTLFKEIEKSGGYLSNFMNGNIQQQIEEAAEKRKKNLAIRKEVLLGTNQFPNFNEHISDYSPIVKPAAKNQVAKALTIFRGSEAFEALRLQTDKAKKQPVAFMLTIGNLAWRKARATFACNFFACAGYKVIDNNGFESIVEGLKAAAEANADIIVLCSSDDEYETLAIEAYKAIKVEQLVIAGAPACTEKLQAEGIKHFIHVKTNILEKLQEFNQILGLA